MLIVIAAVFLFVCHVSAKLCFHLIVEACSVVVDLIFYVPPIVCWSSVFGLCFGIHYFEFFLVLQSS